MKAKTISVVPSISIKATHNRDKFKRWCNRLNWIPSNRSNAETVFATYLDEPIALVRMTNSLDFSAAEDASLLSHEAVHIAMGYFDFLGEDEPSEEFVAYVVQHISLCLIDWHFKWKRKKLDKRL